jgi:hypothetical protein
MILDERRKALLARDMLVRLEPRMHLTVGGGERDEATSETQRARDPAHHHDRGAASCHPARDAAPAALARVHSGYRGAVETPSLRPKGRAALERPPLRALLPPSTADCGACSEPALGQPS